MALAVLIEVLKQFFSRKILDPFDDPRQLSVSKIYGMLHTAFAAELKPQRGARDIYVMISHGGEAERIVVPRVFLIADPDQGRFQQPNHSGQDFFTGKPGPRQILLSPAADGRQNLAKRDQPVVFGFVSKHSPARVVPVLLATFGIPCSRLNVAIRNWADPDITPSGRNREGLDPRERFRITQSRAIRSDIRECLADLFSPDAGHPVADIPQTSRFGRVHGVQIRDRVVGGWGCGGLRMQCLHPSAFSASVQDFAGLKSQNSH